jgi:hypothetical protein
MSQPRRGLRQLRSETHDSGKLKKHISAMLFWAIIILFEYVAFQTHTSARQILRPTS